MQPNPFTDIFARHLANTLVDAPQSVNWSGSSLPKGMTKDEFIDYQVVSTYPPPRGDFARGQLREQLINRLDARNAEYSEHVGHTQLYLMVTASGSCRAVVLPFWTDQADFVHSKYKLLDSDKPFSIITVEMR